MGKYLFFLLIVLPAAEIYLLVQLADMIGGGETLLLILLTAFIGFSVARKQGFNVMGRMQASVQKGQAPGNDLLEGLLVFLGGLLLVAPGPITDTLGLILLFPPTRKAGVLALKWWIAKGLRSGRWQGFGGSTQRQGSGFRVYTYTSTGGANDFDFSPFQRNRPMRDVTPHTEELPETSGNPTVIDVTPKSIDDDSTSSSSDRRRREDHHPEG